MRSYFVKSNQSDAKRRQVTNETFNRKYYWV